MYKYNQNDAKTNKLIIFLIIIITILSFITISLILFKDDILKTLGTGNNSFNYKDINLQEKDSQLNIENINKDAYGKSDSNNDIEIYQSKIKNFPEIKSEKADYPTITAKDGRANLSQPFIKNKVILVNRLHPVDWNYIPHLASNGLMQEEAWQAYLKMEAAAKKDGITFTALSCYRSFEYQLQVNNYYLKTDPGGKASVDKYSAPPGASEHQTGLAVDIANGSSLDNDFDQTPAGIWLHDNAYKFGFIIRFPKDKEKITGYYYEPWHFRYVGEKIAKDFGPRNTLTLEEYLHDEPAPAPNYN